jgi:cell division septation protein DedD
MATAVVPAAIGFLIDGYFIANDPSRPARMFRNTFAGHQIHLSQDHSACSSAAEQFDPLSRACAAVYQILAGNRMDGGRAFDFGWQRNANSWFVVQDPSGTSARPAAGPHFRLTRRDRPRPDTDAFIDPGADAWADPLPGPLYAAPPHATLSGVVDDQALGSAVTLLVTPSGSVARVTYYADEVELGSQTAAPFRLTWASGAWTRRYAHVYAMVTDAQGNSAFTQVIRLQRFSVGSPPTPAPTSTPGPTPTSVITPTPTRTATPGPTPTRTVTPGPTPTRTATPGPTPTRTATPGPTPTRTPTPRRTATPTATPRPEPEGRAITAGSEAGAPSGSGQTFSVQVGAYADPANAQARVAELRRAGFRPVVVSDGRLLRVYAGTFVQRAQAEQFAQQLRIRGYRAVITP